MTPSHPLSSRLDDRRLRLRRGAILFVSLAAVTALAAAVGIEATWPLFFFPLIAATVFFYETGSLIVTFWVANCFVLWYSLSSAPSSATLRQALLGTALFLVSGLVLGRVQRRHRDAQALLAANSLTDRLTGLYNYGSFVDHLHREITSAHRYGGDVSLIMLDLDHFKRFNDEFGHEFGNLLLSSVGETLRAHLRDADIAARYGGEEFAVLMRGDEVHAFELAQRLRRAIASLALETRDGRIAGTSVSAGVATYPAAGGDESELIECADAALYESKRRGRDRVTIYAGDGAARRTSAALTA